MKAPKPRDPKRSALMARVRRKDTAAEAAVAKTLRSSGVAYRKSCRSLPGSPDFANRRRGWAIFVHGCFWHHHSDCPRATVPKTNPDFWRAKFADNRLRDARAIAGLERDGFRVAVVWECQIDDAAALRAALSEIIEPRGPEIGEPLHHRRVVVDVAGPRRRVVSDRADR
ncbi:MAG: very short patch repair endonuclease [Alphaproteobacteria bacterium]